MIISKSNDFDEDPAAGGGHFLRIVEEERTSKSKGDRGINAPVDSETRSKARMRWNLSGKYCGVGMSRAAPRVTWTRG